MEAATKQSEESTARAEKVDIPEEKKETKIERKEVEYKDFKNKTVAFWRGGQGLGDMVQCIPLFRRIKEQGAKRLEVWTWKQVEPLIQGNPYIDKIHLFPDQMSLGNMDVNEDEKGKLWSEYIEKMNAEFDIALPLSFSVEGEYMKKTTFMGCFADYGSLKEVQEKAKGVNWYEEMARVAGLKIDDGDSLLPEFYFTELEDKELQKFKDSKGKKIYMLWNPVGSSNNKLFMHVIPLITAIADKFFNTEHFIAGTFDTDLAGHPRIHTIADKWSLRKVISFMRGGFDAFVGCESVLANASGAFDIPKLIYYTHAYPESIGKNFKNHDSIFPVFSPEEKAKGLDCYPCYWIPVDFRNIWTNYMAHHNAVIAYKHCMEYLETDPFRPKGYRCITHLNLDDFVNKIQKMIRKDNKKGHKK